MPYRLVVMGSCGVGKTALTIRFLQNRFVAEYEPTGRDMYHGVAVVDGESCELNILDISGGENCAEWLEECIRWGDGFLCVYAVDYIKTFEDVSVFWNRICKVRGTTLVPMVLVANKTDEGHWLVKSDVGQEAGDSFGVPYVEASAKTRQGVEHTFHAVIREIRRKQAADELKGCPDGCDGQCFGHDLCTLL
ncbi:ras-like protein 1 [Trichosurus vulpecula]|uniref:ras-like protein 1 n=1 Tax=Trichosurus vulpecula TaxID=9337 RepID=UPI00186B48FB|nr:ras-like protein 1 [Trichosurus vulpecula]